MPEPIAIVDPGPNLVQYLSAVGARLGPDYEPVFFARHIKSRSLLARLGHEPWPRPPQGVARGLPKGVQIDAEYLVGRLRKPTDIALVRHLDPRYFGLVHALVAFFDRFRPTGVLVWNGSGLAAAVAEQLAQARGIPRVYAENGYLPGTLQIDPQGVNAFSSIGQELSLAEIQALRFPPAEVQEFDAMLAAYRAGQGQSPVPPPGGRVRAHWTAYLAQALQDLREREPSIKGNRLVTSGVPAALPGRFWLFPLQVKSDSQLTIHSPVYGNRLEDAVADVAAALGRLDPQSRLVVKLHPADLARTDYDAAVRAQPNTLWLSGGDVRDLLQRAQGVVTVNSTVGVEGLVFGKPVVALGRNFYVRPGLVFPVTDRAELPAALGQAMRGPPGPELVNAYLRYLYLVALVRGHWRDYSEASLGRVAGRIRVLVHDQGQLSAPG